MSGILIIALDDLPDTPSRLLYCSISLCCSLTAAGSTYGLGGFLRYCKGSRRSTTWHFFQPFAGGKVFVASQALGWTLFSLSLACAIKLMLGIVQGVVEAVKVWALASGGFMVITELVLGILLFTFRPGPSRKGADFILRNLPVLIMYIPVHIFCATWSASFTLFPTLLTLCAWIILLVIYYSITLRGSPHLTGCRRWPAFISWMERNLQISAENWFGKVQIFSEEPLSLSDHKRKFIFGYHPHGLYPIGAGILQYLPSFKSLLGSRLPVPLCASAMFFPPLLRDLLCWAGAREVSRPSFIRALEESGSVLLCPGGQEELVESYRAYGKDKEIVICSRHKGFIRLAVETGASLVPLLAIGEIYTLRNAFNAPKMQKTTYRILGFPIPYLVVGKWRVLPLPNKIPLIYIFGKPIEPPPHSPGTTVAPEVVEALHKKFFESMVEMFNKYKDKHPLCVNAKIVLQQ